MCSVILKTLYYEKLSKEHVINVRKEIPINGSTYCIRHFVPGQVLKGQKVENFLQNVHENSSLNFNLNG